MLLHIARYTTARGTVFVPTPIRPIRKHRKESVRFDSFSDPDFSENHWFRSVRTNVCPASTRLGPVRFGSVLRSVRAGSRINRFRSVRPVGPVRSLIPSWNQTIVCAGCWPGPGLRTACQIQGRAFEWSARLSDDMSFPILFALFRVNPGSWLLR